MNSETSLRMVLCVLAMIVIGVLAFAWWGASWIMIIFFIIGLACLAAILYTWMTSRRIDKLLDKQYRTANMKREESDQKLQEGREREPEGRSNNE